jgi:hypothetical protein
MKVKILKAVRVAGKEYYPPAVVEFDDGVAERLIQQGLAQRAEEAGGTEADLDFESVGDIADVLPTSAGGEGEQYAIDSLVGEVIVITGVSFDKGRSGGLEGKDIATVQIRRRSGEEGWFTTWSGPMIAQLKQLVELSALPRKCRIEEKQSRSGRRYYILASAKAQARGGNGQQG